MSTYLLTWNACREDVTWAQECADSFRKNNMVKFAWACGNSKRIREGDRVFFLRQRMEPRGLVALGYVERSPYFGPHWDTERANQGDTALFVDAVWEYFSEDPIIPRTRLDDPPFSQVHWNTQKSGISVPDEVAELLDGEFRSVAGQEAAPLPEEITGPATLSEGAMRRVTINAYERNPQARMVCLQHYGTACSVCGLAMGDIYGPEADGHIHVHHIRPISTIGKSYEIDPIRDLRPVCPNCHAVIRLGNPAYSIEQVKSMLAKSTSST